MWFVKITTEASQIFLRENLSEEDRIVIESWAKLVKEHGPGALLLRPQIWDDHELYGKWKGYRSSRFSYSGRIIYRLEEKVVTVVVFRITANHNYK